MLENCQVSFQINKSLFKIDYGDLQILEKIGSGGSNSVVFKCKYKDLIVAFKCFKIENWMEEHKFKEFEKELNIFANVRHPYILGFYGATLSEPRFGLVLEYCELGNIEVFLKKYKLENGEVYPYSEKLRILFEVSTAIQYLHELQPPIIHRDIKCENVLVTKNFESRLMDFGLSIIIRDQDKSKTMNVGTSAFMAVCIFLLNSNFS